MHHSGQQDSDYTFKAFLLRNNVKHMFYHFVLPVFEIHIFIPPEP